MLTEVAGEIVLPKIMASMIDSGIGAEVAGLGTGYICLLYTSDAADEG